MPNPSTIALAEGWEKEPPAPPAVAIEGDDEALYEIELRLRFFGPSPEGIASVHPAASEALHAVENVATQAIRNRPNLAYTSCGYGVRRIG